MSPAALDREAEHQLKPLPITYAEPEPEGPGLLVSPVFWLIGIGCLALWSALAWIVFSH